MLTTKSPRSGVWRERIGATFDEMQAITAKVTEENRAFTVDERKQLDQFEAEVSNQRRELNAAEMREQEEALRFDQAIADKLDIQTAGVNADDHQTWRDRDGRSVYVLTKHGRFQDLPSQSSYRAEDLSLGRLIRGIATGDPRKYASAEYKALGENSNQAGGFLVPAELSSELIDAARAASVTQRAGALTVPMQSETLTIAKVVTDPTFELKAENAAFTGSDPTFGAVGLTAHTFGTYVTLSRELAADAPNIEDIIMRILSRALAAELDRQALQGSASAEWNGLTINSDIGTTSSVGAIAWEDIATGVVDVQGNNYAPNAYVASPTIAGDLAVLTSGDGVNSAKSWLGPPPNVEPLDQLVTTNCPDANIIIGQWDNLVFGLRQEFMLEATTTGGDAFTKHQLLIKITFRGDVGVSQAGAFHRLDGITT